MGRRGRVTSRLHCLDPDVETPVYFLDAKRKLGAIVILSSKSIALMTLASQPDGRVEPGAKIAFSDESMVRGPITVRLAPCSAAKARLVDPDGKPVKSPLLRNVNITLVVTPGPPRSRTPFRPASSSPTKPTSARSTQSTLQESWLLTSRGGSHSRA